MTETCGTCRHAILPELKQPGFTLSDYRHCRLADRIGLPVKAWLIGHKARCSHRPSAWVAK